MKMIGHDHFICHSYCIFPCFSHFIRQTYFAISLMNLLICSKMIYAAFSCFVSIFLSQYDIFYYLKKIKYRPCIWPAS